MVALLVHVHTKTGNAIRVSADGKIGNSTWIPRGLISEFKPRRAAGMAVLHMPETTARIYFSPLPLLEHKT